ncbi:ABZJ_00895 family protein [Roseobacter sp. HKCCA0434]|uniref:ABZJ_00895 family protein n=1 Tax=Roseobacter sp. HKCCA0434 TaxID=3079297 RepID=UPI0029058688|nr:ABZJ_00895 family protein [Roseobacter sp. HKCCA0434]
MTDPAPDRPRTPYLGTYLLWLVGTLVALTLLEFLLAALVDFGIPPGVTAIIPAMVAANQVGDRWGRERGVPTPSEAWRWAIVAAIAFLAMQLLLAPLAILALGLPMDGTLAVILVMTLALFTAAVIFVNRFFMPQAARRAVAKG